MNDDQINPQNFKTFLYTFLSTRLLTIGPPAEPPPDGVQAFPSDKMFVMQLMKSDGTIETFSMLRLDWTKTILAMIEMLGKSGDPLGKDLLKWCEDHIPRKRD